MINDGWLNFIWILLEVWLKGSNPYLTSLLCCFGYLPYNLESHLSICMIAEIHLSVEYLTFYWETGKSQPRSLSVWVANIATYIPYCLQLFGGYMIKLAVMWISAYVTEIPRAIITPWKCCSARFRPDNKNWCFCASFNPPLLFALFLEEPLITTPVTVGACWQQRNSELVAFCFINLCPSSLLHPALSDW